MSFFGYGLLVPPAVWWRRQGSRRQGRATQVPTCLRRSPAGKSALLHRLLSGRFRADLPHTYGAECGAKRVRRLLLLEERVQMHLLSRVHG